VTVGNHGGVDVLITLADTSFVLVGPDNATVGLDTLTVTVPNGQRYFYYNLQGKEGVVDSAKVQLTFEAPGFTSGAQTVTVRPAAFDLYPIPSTTTTLSDSTSFYAYIGYERPGFAYVYEQQPIRVGGQPATVTIVNDTAAVGELVTTTLVGDAVTVDIPVGASNSPTSVAQGGVAYRPDIAGITTISASIPGFAELTYYNRAVTVTAPSITLYERTVGSGLQPQSQAYGFLSAPNHGGVNVTIQSSAPGVAALAPDNNTVGTGSVIVSVPDGQQYFYYTVQGVEDTTGTATLTATASGFTDGTAPVNVVQPAVSVFGLPTSTAAGADSTQFYAAVGWPTAGDQYLAEYQDVRPGSGPLTVTFTSSAPAIGELLTSAASGASVTVEIAVGSYNSPTTVATGGAAFKPLTAGTTVVTGAATGFITTSVEGNRTVTVNP
jgi:hypothetical protein